MEPAIKTYKKKFDRDLKHIKLILTRQRIHLPVNEWLLLVQRTKESILVLPQDFFCCELPPPKTYHAAISLVFDGFLEDQRVRAVQTLRPLNKLTNEQIKKNRRIKKKIGLAKAGTQ